MSIDIASMGLNYVEDDFFNPKYKIDFIQYKYTGYSKKSLQQIVNVFKKIGNIEKQFEKDMALFSSEQLQSLFEINRWISKGVFENKQSLIKEYMRWYRGEGLNDWKLCNISKSIGAIEYSNLSGINVYKLEWFVSLEELQNEIDVLFNMYNGVDDHELDTAITLIYLAWYDVDSEEAVKIKRKNISRVDDQIYLPISERFIDIDIKPMEFIREYMESEGYSCATRGGGASLREYKPSEFLLRSIKQDYLTENANRSMLSKLSELYRESGNVKRFKYDRIQRSGVYVRLIEHEKQYGELTTQDVNVFEKYFRIQFKESLSSMGKFYNILKDFQKYKEYYFNKINA